MKDKDAKSSVMEFHPYFSHKCQDECIGETGLFASYGSPFGIDVIPKSAGKSSIPTLRHLRCLNQLSAKQPCLPMCPPNKVAKAFSERDPCMSQILEDNARIKAKYQSLKEFFSKIYGKRTRNSMMPLKKDMDIFTQRVKNLLKAEADGASAEDLEIQKTDLVFNLGDSFQTFCDLWTELLYKKVKLKKVNYRYTGGLLKSQALTQTRDSSVILYCAGESLQTLYGSNVEVRDDEPSIIEHGQVDVERKLFQIDSTVVNDTVWCLGRHETDSSLYKVQYNDSPLAFTPVENTAFDTTDVLSSVSLSPYLEGEYLIATENGDIFMKNSTCNTKTKLVHCSPNFKCDEPYWGCEWGMHPREISITNRTGVLLYDIRAPGSDKATDLFKLPHSLLHSKERIYVSMRHPQQTHYRILSTDRTVVLLDQRFPNHPVLYWRHLIETPPAYIDICCDVTDGTDMIEDVLLLGSQLSGELHCMQMTMKNLPGNTPAWTCIPWRASPIRDLYRYTADEGLVVDPLIKEQRLKAPLAGIAAVPLQNKQGFTALQLTSLGDLFHQTYIPSQNGTDKTKTYGPGSKSVAISKEYLNVCHLWLKEAETLISTQRNSETSEDEETVGDNRTMSDNGGGGGCDGDNKHTMSDNGGGDSCVSDNRIEGNNKGGESDNRRAMDDNVGTDGDVLNRKGSITNKDSRRRKGSGVKGHIGDVGDNRIESDSTEDSEESGGSSEETVQAADANSAVDKAQDTATNANQICNGDVGDKSKAVNDNLEDTKDSGESSAFDKGRGRKKGVKTVRKPPIKKGGDIIGNKFTKTTNLFFQRNRFRDVTDVFNDLCVTDHLPHVACSFCRAHPESTLENFTCILCGTGTLLSKSVCQGVHLDFPDLGEAHNGLKDNILSKTNLEPTDTYSSILLKLWNGEPVMENDLKSREAEWRLKNKTMKTEVKKKEKDSSSSGSSLSEVGDSEDDLDKSDVNDIPGSQMSLFSLLGISSASFLNEKEDSVSVKSEATCGIGDSGNKKASPDSQTGIENRQTVKSDSQTGTVDSGLAMMDSLTMQHNGQSSEEALSRVKKESLTCSTPSESSSSTSRHSGLKAFLGLDSRPKSAIKSLSPVGKNVSSSRSSFKPPKKKRRRRSSTSSRSSVSSETSIKSYASSVLGFGATPTKLRQSRLNREAAENSWSDDFDEELGIKDNTSFGFRQSQLLQSPTIFKSPSSVKKKKRKSIMGF